LHNDALVCPVCRQAVNGKESLRGLHSICGTCGTLVLNLPDSVEAYPADYFGMADEKFSGAAARVRRFWHYRRARLLRRLLGPGDFRIYDIGCGDGLFLHACRDLGFAVQGCEPEDVPRRQATERLGCRIDQHAFANPLPDGYDVITAWQVIEHVQAPNDLLIAAQKYLRPDGLLAVSTVNLHSMQSRFFGEKWLHLDPPRHLWVAGRRSVERMIESNGFTICYRRWNPMEFGPVGFVDSFFNLFDVERDRLLRRLKTGFHGWADRMLWFAAAALTPPAILLSVAETVAGRSATFELYARPTSESVSNRNGPSGPAAKYSPEN